MKSTLQTTSDPGPEIQDGLSGSVSEASKAARSPLLIGAGAQAWLQPEEPAPPETLLLQEANLRPHLALHADLAADIRQLVATPDLLMNLSPD
jgi:hypothetical protein